MKPIFTQSDFRTYEPEIVKDSWGNKVKIQLCEELIAGRWEGFYSMHNLNYRPTRKEAKKLKKTSI